MNLASIPLLALGLGCMPQPVPGWSDPSAPLLIPLVEIQKDRDGEYRGQVSLMDPQGNLHQAVPCLGHPFVATLPRQDRVLIGSGSGDPDSTGEFRRSRVTEWDLGTGKPLRTIKHPRALLMYNNIRDVQYVIPISFNDGMLWILTTRDQETLLESVLWETGAVVGQYTVPFSTNMPRIFALPGRQCLLIGDSFRDRRDRIYLVSKEGTPREVEVKLEPGEYLEDALVDESQIYLITGGWTLIRLHLEGSSVSVARSGVLKGAPERTPYVLVPGARKDELAILAGNDRASATALADLNSWSIRKKTDRDIQCLRRYGTGYASFDFFRRTLSLLDADLAVISQVTLERPEDTLIYWR